MDATILYTHVRSHRPIFYVEISVRVLFLPSFLIWICAWIVWFFFLTASVALRLSFSLVYSIKITIAHTRSMFQAKFFYCNWMVHRSYFYTFVLKKISTAFGLPVPNLMPGVSEFFSIWNVQCSNEQYSANCFYLRRSNYINLVQEIKKIDKKNWAISSNWSSLQTLCNYTINVLALVHTRRIAFHFFYFSLNFSADLL